jgi:hypothetical protein
VLPKAYGDVSGLQLVTNISIILLLVLTNQEKHLFECTDTFLTSSFNFGHFHIGRSVGL